MRPVGALIFGLLADRYGRRMLLMANVIFFSVIELLCGFSPSYTFFLVMRALYGIGMGGEWGVGASLAMEAAPRTLRGILSGILQSGYSVGYILAAVAARFVLPTLGWRWMFWLGGIPALLALYIRARCRNRKPGSSIARPPPAPSCASSPHEWKRFAYLVLLMTFMMFLSHGTQDLYPDFLKTVHRISPATHRLTSPSSTTWAPSSAPSSSASFPKRSAAASSMVAALALALIVIPLWAFGWTPDRAGARRLPDAGGRAGRLGNHSRAPERNVARRDPRTGARHGLPAGHPLCLAAPTASNTRCATASATSGRSPDSRSSPSSCWRRSSSSAARAKEKSSYRVSQSVSLSVASLARQFRADRPTN